MLIQSARLGERGSIPEGSQRPAMYSQTIFFFFLNQRFRKKSLSTCVSKSAFTLVKRQTLAHTSWSKMPGHLDIEKGQHLVRVSVAELKTGIPSFRRARVCLHTIGYFRGDSLQKSCLKPRKIIVLKSYALKRCEHSNRSQKNVRLDSPACGSPAGWQSGWGGPCCGQPPALGAWDGWTSYRTWAQKENSLYHLSSSSLLMLRMGWESSIWSHFCMCFGCFWSWFEDAGTCCETRHFHNILAALELEADFSPSGTTKTAFAQTTVSPVLPISPSAFKIHSFIVYFPAPNMSALGKLIFIFHPNEAQLCPVHQKNNLA